MNSPKEGGDFPNKKEFKAKIIFFHPVTGTLLIRGVTKGTRCAMLKDID